MDLITFQVIRGSLVNACKEAGIVLRNTAFSPNIKERMDHSTAIITPNIELVAQAEHIPVHLGSMSWGVKNTLKHIDELEEGDIIIVNDPYIAGTHLPDLLMIKPVFFKGEIIAFVVNKAHHSDIGGMTPGSMPSDASEIYQEGLIIPPVKLVKRGRVNEDILRLILANVRTPKVRLGDIEAQISANMILEKRIVEIAKKYGTESLLEVMEKMLVRSERMLRRRIAHIPQGKYQGEDYLEAKDKILRIKATIEIKEGNILIDFRGSDEQVDEPINAVMGVTLACVLYVLKTISDPYGIANDGYLRITKVYAPEGTIVNAKPPAPVSGGNVETSQRIVDVLFKALSKALPNTIPAASQGTMNNISVGGYDEKGNGWTFYETIGGGMGARPMLDGLDGVHTHMTNTMNTPIEVLEKYYPIMFVKYELRRDSCGAGMWRGGCGIERVWIFLGKKATLSIMGNRVYTRPWGLKGGMPGAPAEYIIEKSDGKTIRLKPMSTIRIFKGDKIIIRTPGGGGYGDPLKRDREKVINDYLNGKISKETMNNVYNIQYTIGEGEKPNVI